MRRVIVGVVLAWSATAHAKPPPALAFDLGFPIGVVEVADQSALTAAGFRGGLGVPAGPLLVEFQLDWAPWFGGRDAESTHIGAGDRKLTRAGASVRWDWYSYRGTGATIDVFTDAGVGWQRLARPGVIADRPDGEVGLGMEEDIGDGRQRGGVLITVRMFMSPITAAAQRFACEVGCPPSGQRGTDLGVLVGIGGVFRD